MTARSSSSPPLSRAARLRVWKVRLSWVVGLWLVGAAGLWGWRDDEISPVSPDPVPPLIVQKLRASTIRLPDGHFQFNAQRVEFSPDGKQTLASGVSEAILFRGQKRVLTLSAPRVRLDNTSSNLEASGGVKAWTPNQLRVEARRVAWNYARKTLSSSVPVKAKLREFDFTAPRLEYNWASGDLTCNAPVELVAPGVRLRGTHLKASTRTRALDLGGGSELSFNARVARPDKWKDLLKF